MVGWSTDTKNGYDDLEEYMEYGYLFVSLTDRNRAKMAYSLFKFKKRAIRFITRSKYTAHTDPLFKQANLQPISDLFVMNILQMHHRFKHGKFRNVSWIYSTKLQCVHTTLEQILF